MILLSYLFYFAAAIASPLQRRWLAKKHDVDMAGQIRLAFFVTLIIAILGLPLALVSPFELSGNLVVVFSLVALCGVFGAGFFVTSYVAQRHIDAGVSSIISNIYTPITIVLATVFLGEGLSSTQVLGTVLLLAGMLVVSKKHRIGRFSFDRHFYLMLLSGAFLGIVLTLERLLQKITGFSAATILSWWAECLFLGLAVLMTKGSLIYTKHEVVVTGVLRYFQQLSWVVLVFTVGNLSVVASITTFKIVFIFIAAAILLNERDDIQRKIIGSLLAVGGLLLMK